MEIKKSTLRWVIPVVIVTAVLGAVLISSAEKKNKEERTIQELRNDIEREYRNLKNSFYYYAEIACDWDYSQSTREHATKKMYELTGLYWHNGWRIYPPNEMKEKISERKSEIEKALRLKASENVRAALLGE